MKRMSTKTRFEEEAKGNSEMAYSYSVKVCFQVSSISSVEWGGVVEVVK